MNTKMRGQRIVEVPEIEGSLPCQYFGKNLCAGCYSEDVYRIRRVKVTGRARTPRKGLLRAGVWREWTYEDWKRLKQLFPERRYFLVSRGLWKPEHYEEVLRDPSCVNLQVSTWRVGDGFSPDRQTLQWLLSTSPKTIIRLLTTQENAPSFAELVKEMGMWWRFMETPLRKHGGMKTYGTETPLQALGVRVGIRCNTPCEDCTRENGILGCACHGADARENPFAPRVQTRAPRAHPQGAVRLVGDHREGPAQPRRQSVAAGTLREGEGTESRNREERNVADQGQVESSGARNERRPRPLGAQGASAGHGEGLTDGDIPDRNSRKEEPTHRMWRQSSRRENNASFSRNH